MDARGTERARGRMERIAVALPKGRLFPQALIDTLRIQAAARRRETRCD
jgi:hypothetical protein